MFIQCSIFSVHRMPDCFSVQYITALYLHEIIIDYNYDYSLATVYRFTKLSQKLLRVNNTASHCVRKLVHIDL